MLIGEKVSAERRAARANTEITAIFSNPGSGFSAKTQIIALSRQL